MKKFLCFLLAAVSVFLFAVPVCAAVSVPMIYNYDDMEVIPADEDITIKIDRVPGAKSYVIKAKALKYMPGATTADNEECLPGCSYSFTVTARKLRLESDLLVPGHYMKIYVEARDAKNRHISHATTYLFVEASNADLTPEDPWYYIDTAGVPGILSQNSTGRYVKWLQQALNRVCSAGLDIDGSFGSKTKQAVESFQKRVGISVNGSVNTATADALIRALEDIGCYSPYPAALNTADIDFVCWQQNENPLKNIPLPSDSDYKVSYSGCGGVALVNAISYLTGVRYDDETAKLMTEYICRKAGITRQGCYVYGMVTNSALRSEYGFDYLGSASHDDVGAALAACNGVAFVVVPNKDLRYNTTSKSCHIIVLTEYDPKTRRVFVLDSFEYITSSGTHKFVDPDEYSAETAYGYWCDLDDLTFENAYFIDLKAPTSVSAPISATAHSPKPQDNPEREETMSSFFSALLEDLPGYTKVKD